VNVKSVGDFHLIERLAYNPIYTLAVMANGGDASARNPKVSECFREKEKATETLSRIRRGRVEIMRQIVLVDTSLDLSLHLERASRYEQAIMTQATCSVW
jgi:hypothetical protein